MIQEETPENQNDTEPQSDFESFKKFVENLLKVPKEELDEALKKNDPKEKLSQSDNEGQESDS